MQDPDNLLTGEAQGYAAAQIFYDVFKVRGDTLIRKRRCIGVHADVPAPNTHTQQNRYAALRLQPICVLGGLRSLSIWVGVLTREAWQPGLTMAGDVAGKVWQRRRRHRTAGHPPAQLLQWHGHQHGHQRTHALGLLPRQRSVAGQLHTASASRQIVLRINDTLAPTDLPAKSACSECTGCLNLVAKCIESNNTGSRRLER